ncbi:MAG: nickel pincer cofactor biosynthesis protein LarC [Planctomycetota bacterium]
MKIAYFDCFSGISGDMILGALVDAGLPSAKLQQELKRLSLSGYHLKTRRVKQHGIIGTKIDVIAKPGKFLSFSRMLRIIKQSRLDESVKKVSLQVLNRLGKAEVKVHGLKSLKDVHLHELGSLDTIIDIVGSVAGLNLLGIDQVYAGALPLTSGMVRCAHGELPVPAPAAAELIKNWPLFYLNQTEELVTPTGAAILTTLAQPVLNNQPPIFTADKIGYGAGEKKLSRLAGRPNLLRLIIGATMVNRPASPSGQSANKTDLSTSRWLSGQAGLNSFPGGPETDRVWILETNIDDVSPQIIGYLFEKILVSGALDVFVVPIQMKKSRPGFLLSVITSEDKIAGIESLIFSETGTLGIRRYPAWRSKLKRVFKTVKTRYGTVTVKIGYLGNKIKSVLPEYEDCRKIARLKKVPLKEIMTEIIKQAHRNL